MSRAGLFGVISARPNLRSGDGSALFAELFDQHAAGLQRYVTRRIGVDAAEDVVSETFLIAYRRRGSYDRQRADVRVWLYGIATNLIRRHRDREIRELHLIARVGPLADHVTLGHEERSVAQVDAQVRVRQLAVAVAALTPADRDVLLLIAWAQFDAAQVAEALSIPVGTVRSRLHRVRSQLRAEAGRMVVTELETE